MEMEALVLGANEEPAEDPENPFRLSAARGYAWGLLDDVADRSSWSCAIVAHLLKAQTWMEQAGLRETLGAEGNSFAQACSHVSRHVDELFDFRTLPGDVKILRLNPTTFERRRESLPGDLDPIIVRTIVLTRLRYREMSLHPVLDRADEVFRHMDRCLPRPVPMAQQDVFLMAALSGPRGFNPQGVRTPNAPNQEAMRALMNKLAHKNMRPFDGHRLSDFFEVKKIPRGKILRYTPTPELIEFLGGEDAIADLKRRVLDGDGRFPLPIHYLSVEKLEALGRTFIAEHGGEAPPADAPPPVMERYGLDPARLYTITVESERARLEGRTSPYRGLYGFRLEVLTANTDFEPYIGLILGKLNISPNDSEIIAMLKARLKKPRGAAEAFALLSKALNDPSEEVLVGYRQGGSRLGISVVRADALVPYEATL